jgi:hypothetical protein
MVGWRASWVAVTAVLALTGCEEAPGGTDPGGTDPAGSGASTSPAAEAFDFCGIIDLDRATEVAGQLGVLQRLDATGQQIRVTSRRVANAGTEFESETCRYGVALGDLGFELQAYPDRVDRDIPEPAEPREELGEGAFFRDSGDGWFALAVPTDTTYLALTGIFSQTAEPTDAEEGLAGLLLPAIERVPPDAVLAKLAGGDRCAALADPVTRALAGPLEFSRYTEIDGSFHCEFTTSETGRSASVGVARGAAGDWNVDPDSGWTRLDGVDDAWQDRAGLIVVFRGEDVIRVRMLGIDDVAGQVDQDLAAAVVPILTG